MLVICQSASFGEFIVFRCQVQQSVLMSFSCRRSTLDFLGQDSVHSLTNQSDPVHFIAFVMGLESNSPGLGRKLVDECLIPARLLQVFRGNTCRVKPGIAQLGPTLCRILQEFLQMVSCYPISSKGFISLLDVKCLMKKSPYQGL